MKRCLPIVVILFALATSGCNLLFSFPVGGPELIATETYPIDEAIPDDVTISDVILTMAPGNGTLFLGGDAEGLATGEIQYNVADWKPVVTLDGDTFHIGQKLPENNISSTPEGAINEWTVDLGSTLTNIDISCQAGNYTLTFAESLPDGSNIHVNGGVGNLRLVFPADVTANVEIHRGPANIATEGEWTNSGKVYTSGSTGIIWNVKVDFGVGNITLASK